MKPFPGPDFPSHGGGSRVPMCPGTRRLRVLLIRCRRILDDVQDSQERLLRAAKEYLRTYFALRVAESVEKICPLQDDCPADHAGYRRAAREESVRAWGEFQSASDAHNKNIQRAGGAMEEIRKAKEEFGRENK